MPIDLFVIISVMFFVIAIIGWVLRWLGFLKKKEAPNWKELELKEKQITSSKRKSTTPFDPGFQPTIGQTIIFVFVIMIIGGVCGMA